MLEIFHEGSTETSGIAVNDSDHKVLVGAVRIGRASSVTKFDVWNDRANATGTQRTPKLFISDAPLAFFSGTASNGFRSIIQARSCEAYNTIPDAHSNWTIVDRLSPLMLGAMPTNSKRTIEFRVVVPYDFIPEGIEQIIRFLVDEN